MSTYDGATVKIINWSEYNPRKDVRASSWFRLEHSLFESPQFYDFSHSELCFWLYLLCLASKENSGSAYINMAHAERIGRFSKQTVGSAITKLLKNGCILIDVTQPSRERNVDVTTTYATDGRTDGRIGVSEDNQRQAFEDIYKGYPKRKGDQRKKHGVDFCLRHFKSQEQIEKLKQAVSNYTRFCDAEKKTGTEYVLQFATFVNGRWEEWAEARTNAPRVKIVSPEAL